MKIFSCSAPALDCLTGKPNMPHLLEELAESFDEAAREGTTDDNPEGSRYITISHTLAVQISNLLRRAAGQN